MRLSLSFSPPLGRRDENPSPSKSSPSECILSVLFPTSAFMQLASGLTSDSLGQDEGDGHEGGPQQQRGVPHAGVPCHRGGLSREGESRQARVPQEGVLGEHRPRGRQEVPPRRLLHGAEAVRVQRPQALGGAAE